MQAAAWRQIPFRSACCLAQTWANGHLSQAESGLSMESLWTLFQVHLQFLCFQLLLIFLGFCRLWGLWLHFAVHICHFSQRFLMSSTLFFANASLRVGRGRGLLIHTPIAKGSLMCSTSVRKGMD